MVHLELQCVALLNCCCLDNCNCREVCFKVLGNSEVFHSVTLDSRFIDCSVVEVGLSYIPYAQQLWQFCLFTGSGSAVQ